MEKNANTIFLKASLFSLILLPPFGLLPGFPAFRVDDILLLGWLLVFAMQGRMDVPRLAVRRVYILLAMVLLFLVSMLNGLLNGYGASFGDFNQFVRFAKYFAIYLLAATVWKSLDERRAEKLFGFVVACGIGLFGIAVAQYIDLGGFNKYYVHLVAPTQYQTLINDYPKPRPVGMIGNPNELGFMFVIFALLALFCTFRFGKKTYLFAFFLFSFGALMTMSRGSMIGLGVGLAAFTMAYFFHQGIIGKLKVSVVASAMAALLVVFAMLPPVYEAYTWRMERVLTITTDTSFAARLENWSENVEIIKQHPVLGVGPLRRVEFEHAADNEWLLMWRSYGVLGIALLVALFMSSVFCRTAISIKAMYVALVCASFVYMIPTAVFHSLVLFPTLLFLFAFVDGGKGHRVGYAT